MPAIFETLRMTPQREKPSGRRDMLEPPLDAMFHAYHLRNHALDAFFYDVSAIAEETVEQAHRVPFSEGGILVVQPGANDGLTFYENSSAFMTASGPKPRTVVVAGVGSSAVGTAAFAKNVAEAIEAPVAGVVSGYGLKDVLWEALGGWFWFRTVNQARHWFKNGGVYERFGDAFSPDTVTLRELFKGGEPMFDLIVGHSKGNLTIAEALYSTMPGALLAHAHIVTIGAMIYMPDEARRVTDIMGERDWFGAINSHRDLTADIVVPGAWHHTNTDIDAHVDVTDVVRRAVSRAAT